MLKMEIPVPNAQKTPLPIKGIIVLVTTLVTNILALHRLVAVLPGPPKLRSVLQK